MVTLIVPAANWQGGPGRPIFDFVREPVILTVWELKVELQEATRLSQVNPRLAKWLDSLIIARSLGCL
jgi:hypothetical protein